MYVSFGNKKRIFPYPEAFVKEYLLLDNMAGNPTDDLKAKTTVQPNEKNNANRVTVQDGINSPLVSDYWFQRTNEVLEGIVETGEYIDQKGIIRIRFRCYAVRSNKRMEVLLNPFARRNPEFLSVWIRDGLVPLDKVKTDIGEKREFTRENFSECEVRFRISNGNSREKDINDAFSFIREIRQLAEGQRSISINGRQSDSL